MKCCRRESRVKLKRDALKIISFGVDRETININICQGSLYMTPWALHHNANQKSFLRILLPWGDIHGEGGEISPGDKNYYLTE